MRRSGWVLPAVALALWLSAVGYPLLAVTAALVPEPGPAVGIHGVWELLGVSFAWAAAVAAGAVVVGWAPGRFLGKALPRRGWLPVAALMLAPVCVPAYAVFYPWWQSWPPDSALYEWAVENGHIRLLKGLTLYVGLLCWSWPLVAWCTAGAVAATPAHREELLRLDGAGVMARLLDRARTDGVGLALGGLLVFLLVFNNTSSFDIAGIYTFGFELVALGQLGAGPGAMMASAAPAVVLSLAGALGVWFLIGRTRSELAVRTRPLGVGAGVATASIWLVSTVVPVVLFARGLTVRADIGTFSSLYGADIARTLGVAAAGGLAAALVAVGLGATWQDHRPWVRRLGDVQAVGWLLTALCPGIIVGLACEAAYNRPGLDGAIYNTPLILVLGYAARFAFVGALLGRWLALAEPRRLADLRRLDGAQDLGGFLRSSWPTILAGGGAAFAIAGVLSMSELAVTARLQPSGFATIGQAVLHAVHYQRPDTVLLATLGLVGAGLAAGFIVACAWWPLRRSSRRLAAGALALLLVVSGCGQGEGARPLETRYTFGSPGLSMGQFQYPRGIAVDHERRLVYVVDKSARVQKWDFDGRPQLQWRMPQWANGKPTGLGVAPDGRVFVADTHYHRVIAYDGEGRELMRFGRYGSGPGEFIYPTDVAFGPRGRIYVSEYGGNERVNVFSAEGEFLFSFGSEGAEVGQYQRPQGLAFSRDLGELYIADAVNHRIVVVNPQGEPLRVFGQPGRGPGQLAYPYDVAVLDDGTLLVCEFGNNRVQHFDPEGECLGLHGRVGTGDGELRYPWGVDVSGKAIFVLDSGNNRVQVLKGL